MALVGAVTKALSSEDMPQVAIAFAAQDLAPHTELEDYLARKSC